MLQVSVSTSTHLRRRLFASIGQFVAVIEVEEAIAALAARAPDLTMDAVERDFTPMFSSYRRLEATLPA